MYEIGTTLRETRVHRNVTLKQVEDDTKIRVKYLQAMENEDFDIMPGATYVKGFLRTYAIYLGLDPAVILDEYRSRGPQVEEHHEPFGGVSMLGKPRSHRGRNTVVFVAVICLLVLGVIWILGRGAEDQSPGTEPGALGIVSPSPGADGQGSPSASPAAQTKKYITKVRAVDGDSPLEVRRDGARGTTLFAGTVRQGSTKTFTGEKLWLRLGIPSVLKLVVGGEAQPRMEGVAPFDVVVVKGKVEEAR